MPNDVTCVCVRVRLNSSLIRLSIDYRWIFSINLIVKPLNREMDRLATQMYLPHAI